MATTYEGMLNIYEGMLNEAGNSFSRAMTINKGLKDPNLENYVMIQWGNLYRHKGLFDSAFYYLEQAETTARTMKFKGYLAITKMNKARTFLILENADSALAQLRVAESIWKETGNTASLQDTWLLMANGYRVKSELDEAERYVKKAVEANPGQPAIRGQSLINMGEIYFSRGDFPKALENWQEVLKMQKQLNYRYELAYLLLRIAEAYEEEGFYYLAAEYLSQALK
ncbi:MAG: tetratricopeptide repeat protein, partial [Flammeovirgaceae bacterium]